MDKEMEELVKRRFWDGRVQDLFNEVREMLESEPPLSSESDVNEFVNHATWKDLVKELQVATEQVTGAIMAGDSGYSDDFLRGELSAFSTLMKMPDYIREQAKQITEEGDENGS